MAVFHENFTDVNYSSMYFLTGESGSSTANFFQYQNPVTWEDVVRRLLCDRKRNYRIFVAPTVQTERAIKPFCFWNYSHPQIYLTTLFNNLNFNCILPSSGLLRGVRWFKTDVSRLHILPIFKGQDT